MRWPPWKSEPHVPMEIVGLSALDDGQLALLEEGAKRQEEGMKDRSSAVSTRGAILVAASAVLSGTELVTSSGLPWPSVLSLAFYLAAAVVGLLATRSRLLLEPHLEAMIPAYYSYSTITLRRSLLLSRLDAHDTARRQINQRHRLLVWGYALLLTAWVLSAASTAYAFFNPADEHPTQIQIVEGTVE